MSSVSISMWKRLLGIYLGIFIIFTTVFLLLFQISSIHVQKIFFYKGLLFLGLTFILCFTGILLYTKKSHKNFESLLAALILSAALNLSVFIVFPVTFERSVSIFLLSTLEKAHDNNSCKGLTKKQMEAALIHTYILSSNAVNKRVTEQEVIKTVESNPRCIQITRNGINFLMFSRLLSKLYNLKIPDRPGK